MNQNEPTTGELIAALKRCREMISCEECVCFQRKISDRVYLCDHNILTDRLESQEQTIAALTARAEQAEKNCDILEKKWWEEALKKVEAQAFKEKAERERDAAVAVIGIQAKQLKESHVVLCNICKFEDMIGCVHKNHCDGYQLFKWRGLPQDGEGV